MNRMGYSNYSALLNSTCDDQIAWAAIMGRHAITETEFNDRVRNHFGNNPEARISMSAQTMMAAGADCKVKSWHYNASASTNAQIDLKLENIRADHQFSIQLFRGLNHWLDAQYFEFTLGKDNSGNKEVAFVALNSLNEIVYYANIANLHP